MVTVVIFILCVFSHNKKVINAHPSDTDSEMKIQKWKKNQKLKAAQVHYHMSLYRSS